MEMGGLRHEFLFGGLAGVGFKLGDDVKVMVPSGVALGGPRVDPPDFLLWV